MLEFLRRWIGPLTWAYLVVIGSVFIITPEGPIPIVVIGVVSIVLGVLGFAFGWQSRSR